MNTKEFGLILRKMDGEYQAAKRRLAEKYKTEGYSAFKAGTAAQAMLWFRVNLGNATGREVAPSYALLTSVTTDGLGNGITLEFSNLFHIIVFGHNLQPIFEKLLTHEVEWIREFDASLWREPPPNEPYVCGIEIRRPSRMLGGLRQPKFPVVLH